MFRSSVFLMRRSHLEYRPLLRECPTPMNKFYFANWKYFRRKCSGALENRNPDGETGLVRHWHSISRSPVLFGTQVLENVQICFNTAFYNIGKVHRPAHFFAQNRILGAYRYRAWVTKKWFGIISARKIYIHVWYHWATSDCCVPCE